jgi:hypothetical protein
MPNDWKTNAGKRAIVWAVFEKLRSDPNKIPDFLNCTKTKTMAAEMGDTTIPDRVCVYALPEGDRLLDVGCSLILEIPPASVPLGSEEILGYSCTYTLWKPTSLQEELAAKGSSLAEFLSQRGFDLGAKMDAASDDK